MYKVSYSVNDDDDDYTLYLMSGDKEVYKLTGASFEQCLFAELLCDSIAERIDDLERKIDGLERE